MGAASFGIRIVAPASSRRGRKLRQTISRLRSRRAYTFAKNRYNENRQNYYKYAVTKTAGNQDRKISIIVPCYNTPAKYFEPLLASVFDQGYENWELVIADGSDSATAADYLKSKSQADNRITYLKIQNEGIAENTNKGIAAATGELIAFLDHDDTLDPDALAEAAAVFSKQPAVDLVYSDEDKVSDDGGAYFEPHYKPDFSLDMLRNVNYITHFVVAKKTLVDEQKGLRKAFDGAQDYEFLLRVVDSGATIAHIPKILYHWRQAEGSTAADFSSKPHITRAGCRALQEHYERNDIKNATAEAIKDRPGFYRAVYELQKAERQIFINLDKTGLSQIEKDYIVEQYRNNKDVKKYGIGIVLDRATKPDKYSLVVNGPFMPAKDTTDIASLFALASEKGVAGVAPKIVRHGRIFDAGIVKVDGTSKLLFKGVNPDRPIVFGSLEWVRNVDALTGAVGVFNKEAVADKRYIIWSHAEFVAFSSRNAHPTKTAKNFYNPNLAEMTEITNELQDFVADLVEVKK